ncbi:MAG: adenylyl-sulfate kinase [Flavobacteriales bacterium]|nr:adenylyl-sulfate kinase [Flavobacteriales bacterium]
MTSQPQNIHPTLHRILPRSDKEKLLHQRGLCVWMTGLSGSGKTAIAIELERMLIDSGRLTQVLDGDNVRMGINSDLGFTEEHRTENVRRIAEVTRLFVNCGIVTICCFISPTQIIRQLAKAIIGEEDYLEVFISTPLSVCEQRDVKGLYRKARAGEIKNFTGLDAPFEPPASDFIDVPTPDRSVEECATQILDAIRQRIAFVDSYNS